MHRGLAFVLFIAGTLAPVRMAARSTPAEASIAEAQRAISSSPAHPSGYNLLATAFLRRARETSDTSYIQQAEEAVTKSLELDPNNFESQRTRVSVLLAKHEYPEALKQARTLNKRLPDDVLTYGLVSVASAEMGNYEEAEEAGQWMLNLRPGNSPALINTGYLRELFGDPEGAWQVLSLALQATAPTETENRAWLLARMAHMRLIAGNSDVAESLLKQSLTAFPNYRVALEGLAEVRLTQRRYEESITLLKESESTPVRAVDLYAMAQALELAGWTHGAEEAYKEFAAKAEAASAHEDNANRDLVLYYADRSHERARALQLAKQELSWRHDVFTRDSYAWALHVNGQNGEARKQIEIALAVGVRDATVFRHAGEIALSLGDRKAAERYLKQSVEINGLDSEKARVMLSSVGSGS